MDAVNQAPVCPRAKSPGRDRKRSAVFPGNPESASRVVPVNIAEGAADLAGPALQTPFIAYGYSFLFFIPIINMGRAKTRTGFIPALFQADLRVGDFNMVEGIGVKPY
jgi:hypothetical protein